MGVNHVQGANGEQYIDLRKDTVTEDTLAEGYTAHNAAGEQIVGRMTSGGGGGTAVQEIFYVDGTFDMSTLTFTTNVTYEEIAAAVDAGKYIVAKADALMGTIIVNGIYLQISTVSPTYADGIATFEGMMQVNGSDLGLSSGLLMLAVTVEISAMGNVFTRIKVVSTQTIK